MCFKMGLISNVSAYVSTHVHASTDSDMWCMLNGAIKEEHADGGHAYPLALVCGSSGVRCRVALEATAGRGVRVGQKACTR